MKTSRLTAVTVAAWWMGMAHIGAQSLSWDTDTGTAGAQGGTGNWLGTNFWFNGTSNGVWVDNSMASFGGTAGTVTVNGAVSVGGMLFNVGGYTIDGTSTLTLFTSGIDVANAADTATISAPLGGVVGLTKNGPGTLTLSGASVNTFVGFTFVNDGTLNFSKTGANAIGNDLTIGNNQGAAASAIVIQGANQQIPDANRVIVNADGFWNLANGNRSETIGVLELTGGSVATGSGTLTTQFGIGTNGNAATATISGLLNLAGGTRNFDVDDGAAAIDLDVSAVISNGGVMKVDNGTLRLTGANTFTTLQINGGAISIADLTDSGVAGPLGAGTSFSVTSSTINHTGTVADSTNRAITLNGTGLTINGPAGAATLTLSGVISGTGGLTKTGASFLTLTNTNTFTGPVTVSNSSGIFVSTLTNSGVAGQLGAGSSVILNGGGLLLSGGGTHSTDRSFTAGSFGATFSPGSGTMNLTGTISGPGGIATTGGGTLLLSGTNTFAGDVFISGGNVRVANGSAIPDDAQIRIPTGRIFDVNNSTETVGSIAESSSSSFGTVAVGSGQLSIGGDNAAATFGGVITGTGSVIKIGTGTQTLSGASTFTGSLVINAGAISVPDVTDSGVAGPLGAASSLSLNGGTLLITPTANDSTNRAITLNAAGGTLSNTTQNTDVNFSGVISGPGGLTRVGPGSMTLSGNNSFTGPLVSSGSGFFVVTSLSNSGVNSAIGAGNSITLNGAVLIYSGFGTFSTNRPVTLNGGGTLGPGNGNIEFSGPITGTGGLGITGPGVLILSGNNTFAGNVGVGNTIVRVANGNGIPDTAALSLSNNVAVAFDVNNSTETIGSLAGGGANGGNTTLGSGTLTVGANNTSTTYSGIISGTGSFVKIGTGTQTLAGVNTFTGTVTIQNGAISITDLTDSATNGPLGAGSSIVFGAAGTSGMLTYTGASNDTTNRTITVNGGGGGFTITDAAVSLTISTVIGGSGGLTKAGPGTLVLSGANTYTGATTINLGTLRLVGGSAIADSAAVVLANAAGAVLDLNGTGEAFGSLAGGGPLGGNLVLGSTGFIVGQNNTSTTFAGTITGTGGTATGALTKVGTGTLTLSGNNTYSGITSVLAGRLRLSGGNAIGDMSDVLVALNAIAEWLDGPETIGSLRGDGNVEIDSGTLSVGANGISTGFNGIISGVGNFTKVGPGQLNLTTSPTYTGTTTVSSGTLALNAGLSSAGGALTVASGAFLRAQGVVNRPFSGGGELFATGALTIGSINSTAGFAFGGSLFVGPHFVVLADANTAELGTFTNIGAGQLQTFNGATLAAGRSILVSTDVSASIGGDLVNNGTVNGPGNAGQILNLTGDVTGAGSYTGRVRFADGFSPGNGPGAVSLQNFTFDPATALTIEIGGLTAGSQYDRLTFTGTGTLDGTLIVLLLGGFDPVEGNTFTILNGGTLTGAFDAIALPPLDPGLAWIYSQTASAASLVVIPEPAVGAGLLVGGALGLGWRRRRR